MRSVKALLAVSTQPSSLRLEMLAYYALIFLTGAVMADLNNAIVLQSGTLKLMGIDLIDYVALALTALFCVGGSLRQLSRAGRWYTVLLGWLAIEVAIGASRFGASAFGEFRYIAALFWFFVPLAISGLRRTPSDVEGATVPSQTIWVALTAALVILAIEVTSGGRVFLTEQNQQQLGGFTDFRGVRYLDTYQTFNISLAACFLFLQHDIARPNRGGKIALAVALTIAALWTRNRASIVAVFAGFVVLALFERRFRLVAKLGVAATAAVGLLMLLSTSMMANITDAFAGVVAPTQDASGQWRLLLQASALEQALQTPIAGQGYGGYYSFDVPGLGLVVAPPHNQYLELFMKGGVIALLLVAVVLFAYARQLWRLRRAETITEDERLVVRLILIAVIAQIPYGLAYDFPPLFGLLLGCGEVIFQRCRLRERERAPALSASSLIGSPLHA